MNPCVRRRSNLMAPAMDLGHDVRPPFGGPARHEERRRDPVPAGAARLSSRCRCMLSATSPREEDAAMDDVKRQLAKWIDQDRDTIIGFLCDFVRAKSPNPPGDTTLAAAHITRFLEAQGLPFRVIAPQATMPNIVGTFEGRGPGRHLLLNGEPSSPLTIRFGEKGPLWLRFTTRTRGAHGAYTHLSPSATKISARLIVDLEELTTLEPSVPIDIADALAGAAAAIDEAQGPGAKDIIQRVTVNIGVIQGGQKVNMVPGTCWFEADVRLPPGLGKDAVLAKVRHILARYPDTTMEEINFSAPSACDPNHEMVGILRANARALGRPGLAAAYRLAGTHGLDAVVLEANAIGWGASGRNGGFALITLGKVGLEDRIRRWGIEAARRSIAIGVEAIETVRELIAREHIACDPGPDGSLLVAHRPSAVADLQERVRLYREVLGYPHVEFLDHARLEHDGYLRGAEASGALR